MHYCPGAEIIGVEPIPEKVAHLRRKFPNVKFMECALGESEGEATFYVHTRRSGFSTLGRPKDSFASQYVETRVPIKKLDNLVASDAVDVIKVDVEGAELGILRGGEGLIARSRPTIMFKSPANRRRIRFHEGRALELVRRTRLCRARAQSRRPSGCGLDSIRFPRKPPLPAANHKLLRSPQRATDRGPGSRRAVFKIEAT